MPYYDLECQECHAGFTTDLVKISQLPEQLAKPCPQCGAHKLQTKLGPTPWADPVRLGRQKPDEGFRDILRNIAKHHPGSKINTF